jgi:DNA-binding MarR family transcriptional regulator
MMAVYMIRDEQVTAHIAAPAKMPKGALLICSKDELETSDFTSSQLVALWNALPGAVHITKFKDRKTAARRLWVAFKQFVPTSNKIAHKPNKGRMTTKQEQVIALLRQRSGATIEDLIKATSWQRHTVRGMIAGALKKKLGLHVISEKAERGRVYRITDTATKTAA